MPFQTSPPVSPHQPESAYQVAVRPVAPVMSVVEDRLLRLCGDGSDPLSSAAHTAVAAGGKRLRPALVLLSARTVGEVTATTMDLALAVEVMHLASLLHDDVVDQAAVRRGRPSLRAQSGDRAAVIVGDYLAACAYNELASLRDGRYAQVFTTAAMEMCRAEALFADKRPEDLTEEDCLDSARGKTAVLLAASCQVGALSGGATDEVAARFRSFGEHLGIAFQLTDDLLDIYGREAVTGKAPGRDVLTGQFTVPIVHGLHSSRAAEVRRAIEQVREAEDPAQALNGLAALLDQIGARAATEEMAGQQVALAKAALEGLVVTSHPALQGLLAIADYLRSRRT